MITVPLVHSGSWSVPGLALHPQLIGSTNFGTISLSGTQGLLGSDQLRRYGWVVLDYAGAAGQMCWADRVVRSSQTIVELHGTRR